jgi:Ca2+-transporting ATPase
LLRPLPRDRLKALTTDIRSGVTESEALQRRATYGSNLIAEEPPTTWQTLVRDTAADPMIWFLILTSGLFGVIGKTTDMIVLLLAVAPLVGMDFYLHRRTQVSLAGLTGVLSATATILRDGHERTILAADLVPGDIAIVASGELFPADGLIAAGTDLQAEESSLTGEAYPVAKQAITPDQSLDGPIASEHWGFAGTRLLTGRALFRVAMTGKDTLYGEIVKSAVEGPEGRTRLQASVAELVRLLLIVAILFCLVLAGVRLSQGFGLFDAFLSAATLAVAAIPEEFPVVLTFFLGAGVYRLAKRQALVRRAVAVENIGRVTAICCDKTGTITEGRLSLDEVYPALAIDSADLLKIAASASRHDSGDPLDTAILETGRAFDRGWKRVQLFPFTEARRRETAIWRAGDGLEKAVVKGAAETVLALSMLPPDERDGWNEKIRLLSAGGHKVIGCAVMERPASHEGDIEPGEGFQFAGLLSFSDPLREGVAEAVADASGAGIRVIMVTGDHPQTATAIAREAGIATGTQAMTGDEVEAMLAKGDAAGLRGLSVVARAAPGQKLALVRALQGQGEIVAVTGDGVNDVPALKAADVGIAMGMRGTRSAREVSPIVLLDDNFRTIVGAIAEGRQLFSNLRLSFAFLLMVHIPLVASAALIPFIGFPLLYLPVHIVWLELVIHPAALLAFQQPTPSRLGTHDRDPRFFDKRQWLVIAGTGIATGAALLLLFVRAVEGGQGAEHARTVALVALIMAQVGMVAWLTGLRGRAAQTVCVAGAASSLLFPQIPFLAEMLSLHPLSAVEWAEAAAIGLVVSSGSVLLRAKAPTRPAPERANP